MLHADAVARGILEGSNLEVVLLWWRSNYKRSKQFSCENQLLRYHLQFRIIFRN